MSEQEHTDKPEPTPYERMQQLGAQVMSVPKAEVDKRLSDQRKATAQKRRENRH